MRCLALSSLLLCLCLCLGLTAAYKSEVQITPDPLDSLTETTTKKSSWFGGFKKFFGSDGTTTTTTTTTTERGRNMATTPTPNPKLAVTPTSAQKPPPLVISHAPLMPLGPRPDTPGSSPFGASPPPASGPQWPTAASSTKPPLPQQPQLPAPGRPQTNGVPPAGAPILPPGFAPYRPQKPQPNSYDLSYGGGPGAGTGRPGFGLAGTTTTTTTTTTQRPKSPGVQPNIDVRFSGPSSSSTTTVRPQQQKEDFPALPGPRRPSQKEDFPALPPVKTPPGSPTPTPGSPSAWNSPLPTPQHPVHPAQPTKSSVTPTPASVPTKFTPTPAHGGGSTSTVRPGFQSSGNSVATDDEIRQLTEQLYAKETNSQIGNIQVNIQGRTRSIDSADEAPNPLLHVDSKALESPTIAKMRVLFNNYEHDTLVNEHVTPNERKEENDFLDAVMATPVMRQAMLFLQQKGLVSPDPKTHRDLVKELWFTQYSRGQGKIGSSGFEHVFVHEVKDGTIIGFHNWVYIGDEEQGGRFDYKGYMKEQDIGTKGKILKIRFSHQGLNKPVNTLFVGTSPELELALYTVCFQLRPDRTCPVSLGNSKFGIITYSWRYRGKNLIGSAYPEI
ncbi:poly(U)-specific endoribonuclease homolog [Drosophila serrata]|uniref:poly(U)-specific endoribonuclease homolog n=1 Tax=Drosophila serrata TaxID=7274 RepID=UPI000A1D156E|nr:poly(U)-specific endoribonuclease homolog [Drosophila serrata]